MTRSIPRRLVVLLLVLLPAATMAMPNTPVPLWTLAAEADLIVVAWVDQVESLPWDEARPNGLAHLEVLETLKGPDLEVLEVGFPASMLCPEPPRYAEGEVVVAFLTGSERSWRTVSFSYGTLYPNAAEREEFKTVVAEAVAIQEQAPESETLDPLRREWAVRAAVSPSTRWHGLSELAPAGLRLPEGHEVSSRLAVAEEDREILAEAFVATPRLDETWPMLLLLVGDHDDSRVDALAWETLEGLLALEEPPDWTQFLLGAVLFRADPTLLDAPRRVTDFLAEYRHADELRAYWRAMKSEFDLPEIRPRTIEPEDLRPQEANEIH